MQQFSSDDYEMKEMVGVVTDSRSEIHYLCHTYMRDEVGRVFKGMVPLSQQEDKGACTYEELMEREMASLRKELGLDLVR